MDNNKSAKQRYNDMIEYREHYLNRGRECSELTLPAILPEDGVNHTSDLYTPYQSVGARGVNNLASKLLLLLLPPNQPFFRLNVDGKTKEEMDLEPQIKTEIEKSLAKIEREVMSEIEALAIRVPVFEALKHLVITGNTLVYMPKKNTMRVFPLSQYTCRRDRKSTRLNSQSHSDLVCRLLLEKKKIKNTQEKIKKKKSKIKKKNKQIKTSQ